MTTTTADEIKRVAAGLSPVARQRIRQPGDGNCPAGAAFQFLDRDLIRSSDDGEGWDWNERGQAVREYLRRGG